MPKREWTLNFPTGYFLVAYVGVVLRDVLFFDVVCSFYVTDIKIWQGALSLQTPLCPGPGTSGLPGAEGSSLGLWTEELPVPPPPPTGPLPLHNALHWENLPVLVINLTRYS